MRGIGRSLLAVLAATAIAFIGAPVLPAHAAGEVITGTVRDSAGPLANANVEFCELFGDGDYECNGMGTSTNASGGFSLAMTELAPGISYGVRFSADGHWRVWLGGGSQAPDEPSAQNSVQRGEANVDLGTVSLPLEYSLRGQVKTASGAALADVEVGLCADQGQVDGRSCDSGTYTDNDGNFSVTIPAGVSAATYLLALWVEDLAPVTKNVALSQANQDLGTLVAPDPPASVTITGKVLTAAGPLAGVQVRAFSWIDDFWSGDSPTFTAADGSFSFTIREGRQFTVQFRKYAFQTVYLGGATTRPVAPDGTTPVAAAGMVLSQTLMPADSQLGKVAGQKLDYCRANILPANDDSSSPAVDLPFNLTFFGQPYSSLYVNNNGNVSFGEEMYEYTPTDLTSGGQTPLIAPFFADVDTNNEASWEVAYGASEDGKSFCVNWETVGYYSARADKLNIFQLILTSREGSAGRSAGDFDVTFNYDQIQWEAGEASGGVDGIGGTSAAVGYTAGTGDPGTYFEMLGSRVPGSFLDGGPQALVARQLNSSQVGRYRFEIRNADASVQLGGLKGVVRTLAGGAALDDATVTACQVIGGNVTRCQSTRSAADGSFSFPALPVGSYQVEVFPPGDGLFPGNATAQVQTGLVADVGVIALAAPTPLPADASITNVGMAGGVPVVYYGEPLALSLNGQCVNASGTWKVLSAAGAVLRSGNLALSGDRLTATIPALFPYTGEGRVVADVTCPSGPPITISFDIYIDPSGTVYDQYGQVVVGATATLLHSDMSDGTFVAVPDGSSVMSPSNRSNPMLTDVDGRFRWDVAAAWYKVKVEKNGCSAYTSPAMEVPPERIDLAFKVDCAAPAPTQALVLSGTATAGSTLTVQGAEFGGRIASQGFRWLRDGVEVGTGGSYLVTEADHGHVLAVEQTLRAPSVVNQLDGTVSFQEIKISEARTLSLLPFSATPEPTISAPGLTVGATLTVAYPTWTPAASFTTQWNRDGEPIAGATGEGYQLKLEDLGRSISVAVTGTRTGFETVSRVSAAVVPPALNALTLTPAPKVTGKAKVGSKLKATVGTWGPAPVTLTYEWLRAGVPIPGANGLTYKVQKADGGSKLSFRVTGAKAGYASASTVSSATKAVPLSKLKAGRVKVKGTAKVGRSLTVSKGTWTSGTAFAYQWLRSGKAILGATGSSYTVTLADAGKKLKVKVTGTKQGYKTVAKTSKATKKIK